MYEPPRKTTNFEDVGLFHDKFGLDNVLGGEEGPRKFDPELIRFRIEFMKEELMEFLEALNAYFAIIDPEGAADPTVIFDTDKPIDHAKAFDALLDLVYVALGTAHFMGYPWQEGWNAVQAANMAKVRAQSDGSDSLRGSSFDVVKPEGWTPPDIGAILAKFGWIDLPKENS